VAVADTDLQRVRYAHAVAPDGGDGDIDLLDAYFRRHVFPRHSHDAFAFGLVLSGRTRFFAKGSLHIAGPGSLLLHDAGSVHTGEPDSEEGWRHRMIYVAPALLARVAPATSSGSRDSRLPSFRMPMVTADPECARLFLAAFDAQTVSRRNLLAADDALRRFLRVLVRRHGGGASPLDLPADVEMGGLTRVRDLIEASYRNCNGLRIADLAQEARLSPSHLITAFRRRFGLPPAAFALQCRVQHAARLLATTDLSLASVAADAGFYDQSDLSRHFARHHGLPPGAYRRGRRIVQDWPETAMHPALTAQRVADNGIAKGIQPRE